MTERLVYTQLLRTVENKGGGFLLLLDPDQAAESVCRTLSEAARDCDVDAILVGSSFTFNSAFAPAVRTIKEAAEIPVLIFPGSFAQITPDADAILFTSLLSGRNPTYLIEEQIKGAPLVKRFGIEPIAAGYLLIESGSLTSVQFVSGTLPIPREKNDIVCAHALAAQYLGMQLVYLEAGSGAELPVPPGMVNDVSSCVEIPVVVGGGLGTPEDCASRIEAGASFVVAGSRLERDPSLTLLRELADATHRQESLKA